MLDIPENVEYYKSSPTFNQDTVPKALLKDHCTKVGTWGLLNVVSGSLRYVVTELGFEEEMLLSSGSTAVIAPEHLHYVEPLGAVEFFVAFHRQK
jgi:tellurite methyltransferase